MSRKIAVDEQFGSVARERELAAKQHSLFARIELLESVLVAFSGGTDSAYLAWAADRALGERALAITALSPSFSAHDRRQAAQFVAETGMRHEFVETHEFENTSYVANNKNRCYFCKAELFDKLKELRVARTFSAIVYGANTDDLSDFRPGHRAARENGVIAPLLEADLSKSDIRELSKRAGLSTWNRPSSPCLSSRIPYGTHVTIENISLVERAEAVLRDFGFRQFRVRFHGNAARIEIAMDELPRALQPDVSKVLVENIKKVGFATVAVDSLGYRQGSLNDPLESSGLVPS